MKKVSSVENYISQSEKWACELEILREILQSTALEETIKWGAPCYTCNGKNLVGMASYTNYFGLWFYQGATLKDTNHKLINAQKGKTKALRQWRMTHANDIKPSIIRRYVKESIENINKGIEIGPTKAKNIRTPPELNDALSQNAKVASAFRKLTPGKQREYSEYVASALQDATKRRRVAKIVPMILQRIGLNDQYRK